MIKTCFQNTRTEAGCDEAGRGCLAGPVVAAAVILPPDFKHPLLNDSKKLTERQRNILKPIIEAEAIDWAVAEVSNDEIDEINILNASFEAMNRAIEKLKIEPELILVDGNRFKTKSSIEYLCVIGGDALYGNIAAASILAKTHRDALMEKIALEYPEYNWAKSKGYPTKEHKTAIKKYGLTKYHRKSFSPCAEMIKII